MKTEHLELTELTLNEMNQISGGDKFLEDLGTSCGMVIGFIGGMLGAKPNIPSNWK